MRGRGPRRRRKPPVPRAEIARKRLASLYARWGSPTPPSGREVLRIMARSNSSRMQSAKRKRRKEATAASFRRAKSQRREYWRRRLGQAPEVVGTKQQPKVISDRERRESGMATKGPRTTLTPEVAALLADCLEAGLSVRATAEKTGHPATTIRHWARSGRIASVLEAHGSEPRPASRGEDRQ